MKNLLFFGAAAVLMTLPALAQNEREGWPIKLRNAPVTFTTTGTYSETTTRLIGVTVRTDKNGDGKLEHGDLRVVCSGGNVLSVSFVPRGSSSSSNSSQSGTAKIPASTTIKGNWDMATLKGARKHLGSPKYEEVGAVAVDLATGQPNLCA